MTDMRTDLVKLTIDGKQVEVAKGTLLIRAAEQLGIIVPRFCDHPLLDPAGACRQCVVEVEGAPKPMMACTTTVAPDQVVKTHLTSDMARKAQTGTLEFLLINHPLDCPMCDKGGECPLQDQSMEHGQGESRFVDQKRRYDKPVAVSSLVLLDRERCVLCARCTRFSEQISGDPFIELFERGALEQVAIYEDEPYHSYFSGNVIQICPVGALTSTDYRFKARPFDTRSAKSVCGQCAGGCNQTVQSRRGEIQRQLARTNMAVNEAWDCDKGRFGFRLLTDDSRITTPLVRTGNDLVEATWAQALLAARKAITDAQEAGPGRVAVIAGGRLADEDAYALSKFTRTVLGSDDLDFRTTAEVAGRVDELRAYAGRDAATFADVEAAPVILTVGLDAEEENPILHLRIRKAWRNHKALVVPVGPRAGSAAQLAWRRLPTGVGREGDALAAVGRGVGLGRLAELAVASGWNHPHLDTVVGALKERKGAVILVGERAGADALSLAGQIADHVGAKIAWVPARAGDRGALQAGLLAGVLPGGRRLDDAADRAEVEAVWGPVPTTPGRTLAQVLADAAAGKIDVLHLVGVDLVRDAPSRDLALKALERVKTVIAQDLAMTETVEHATIVLPATSTQERAGHRTNWEGRSQAFSAAVAAPELAQDDWGIVVQLAAVLGKDLGFSDLAQLRAERDRLGRRARAHDWPTVDKVRPSAPTDGLVLLTHRLLLDRGTQTTGADAVLATARSAWVGLNPADAATLGVGAGDRVTVTAGQASITAPAQLDADLVAGVVFVPRNSTEVPATALDADGSGAPTVTVARAEVTA